MSTAERLTLFDNLFADLKIGPSGGSVRLPSGYGPAHLRALRRAVGSGFYLVPTAGRQDGWATVQIVPKPLPLIPTQPKRHDPASVAPKLQLVEVV